MSSARSFFARIFEYAQQLGNLYGAWVALVALFGIAIAVAKALAGMPRAGDIAFYVAVAVGAVTVASAPLLVQVMRHRSPRPMMMNPSLDVLGLEDEWRITPTGWSRHRKVTVRARKAVDRFRFEFRLTGRARARVRLDTPGRLLGPARRHDGFVSYEAVFREPLQRKHTTDIWIDYHIEDPDKTISPYVAERFSNAPRYGPFRQVLTFEPAELAGSVYYDVRDGMTGQSLVAITPLLPSADGHYTLEVAQVEYGRIYTTSWGSQGNG